MTNQGTKHVQGILTQNHISPENKTQMAMAIKQGSVMGVDDAFMIATWLTIVAFILAFYIRRTSPQEDTITNRLSKKQV